MNIEEQRQADIATAAKIAADLAYATGLKDAAAAQAALAIKENFAELTSTGLATAKALTELTAVVSAIREDQKERDVAQARRDAVNAALIESGKSKGEKKLTKIQTRLLYLGGSIATLSFLLTFYQAFH